MNNHNIYITFDYELFFGRTSGSIDKCMLDPTNRLIEIGRNRGVAFTFFVDAGMLHKMKIFASKAPEVAKQYQLITRQIRVLKEEGHSVQLHVHPHWEDCFYADGRWVFDVSRYRLNQFNPEDVDRIISDYWAALEEVTGSEIHAFRAGGWCIQPFAQIGRALKKIGITIDSTLYRDGHMNTPTHKFDFRGMPAMDTWRFEDDPMLTRQDGWFTEIPIAVTRYSRLFYLSMAFHRLAKTHRFRFTGDGAAVGGGWIHTLKLILKGGDGVVSLDGFRVRQLHPAFRTFLRENSNGSFVVIGHPKALCEQSFILLDELAAKYTSNFAVM